MSSKEFLTLKEVVEYLDVLSDDELSEYELCQLPPEEDHRLTDEEDVNENDLGEIIPADTCGKISLTLPNRDDDGEKEKDSLSRRKGVKQKSITMGKGNVWKKLNQFEKEIPSEPMRGLDNHLEELVALEPIELFFKYLPQQYLSHVANMSSLYAQQKGSSLDVTWEEIAQFFGILLFSGYHTVPQENLYWCSAEDMSIPIIPSVMPRNRFKDIKRYFHLSDNNMLQKGD
ncbi:piggyBac transposable element-derived protein 1-like [Ischnura elegans]|uniref:piggyBac transposable element-derived protein 1-like n=1 Tax=Ischnura elegans TaxID=197161 RepID=UPI001ED88A43|nr:piggyBac transposable element-derived protein 1-like [Ischnura elegans]